MTSLSYQPGAKPQSLHTILIPFENMIGEADSLIVAPATQIHLYCNHCGEVWAHGLTDHPTPIHYYAPARCRHHGSGLLYPHFTEKFMSRDLLFRELELELTVNHVNPNGLPQLYTGKSQFSPNPQGVTYGQA
jgi:hypothetical protein